MNLKDLFRPKWRHSDHHIRLAAMAGIHRLSKLHKIARRSDDERVRLEAARRLGDIALLKVLARSASQEQIRMEAAIELQDQPCLTAIALNTWNIRLGQTSVRHIHNRLLLLRVARSAQQDAIRLAAAMKTADEVLLRQVARSSSHIDVQWQVARHLDDPGMLAEITVFKPGNMRLDPVRRTARRALIAHLDRCRRKGEHQALLTVIRSVVNPIYKLEALVRLPATEISETLLEYLASQNLRYIPNELLNKMLSAIRAAGWRTGIFIRQASCPHCRGRGQLPLKYVSVNDSICDHDGFPCPDCRGMGQNPCRHIVCSGPEGARAIFVLPT